MKLFVGSNELIVNEATIIAAVQLLINSTMQDPPEVKSVSRYGDCAFKIIVTEQTVGPVAMKPGKIK